MRWALTEATDQFHCWRLELSELTAELKYNKKAHSFRIAAKDKRLFFIERTGLLQHKFLIRTEYSVLAGEIDPVRNWHSGIVAIEGKKFNYLLKDGFLIVSAKKNDFSVTLEIDNTSQTDQEEFFALLFGTIRILSKSYKIKTQPELV